jgi:hypothetical protein
VPAMTLCASCRHLRTPNSSFPVVFYAQMLIPAPRSPRSGTLASSMIRNKKLRTAIVRPLAIGLIGLAIAVVLWGIGYRLSLYRPHPDPSVRMGVAKLWVGSRRAVCVSNARTKLVAVTPDPQLLHDENRVCSRCHDRSFGGLLNLTRTMQVPSAIDCSSTPPDGDALRSATFLQRNLYA